VTDPSALVKELDSAGDLPAGFGPLLESVPRELFIPVRIWVGGAPIDRATEPARWLAAVYGDNSIVTQFDDGQTRWPEVGRIPTSSASMPSVVVGMLAALGVSAGQAVLEVGTGTGYNAALLARLVGESGRVTTIEVDDGIAGAARESLARAGFGRVRTVVGDGASAACGGVDRVIATMSVHLGRVPCAWVARTKPGGRIVTPVRAELASGPLVEFTVHGDGTATGRTLPMGVGFMESRLQRTGEAPEQDWERDGTQESITTVEPRRVLEVPSPRWAVAVAVPSCRYGIEGELVWLSDPVSGAWASAVPAGRGRFLVRQNGIRRLWDEVEIAYRWWCARGEPFITEWRWTITPDRQEIGLVR
jgi:protein-L-isoaspartate O-methyltransferase